MSGSGVLQPRVWGLPRVCGYARLGFSLISQLTGVSRLMEDIPSSGVAPREDKLFKPGVLSVPGAGGLVEEDQKRGCNVPLTEKGEMR